MIKKIGFFLLLYAISLIPWVPMYIVPSQTYEDLIWLVGALLSVLLIFTLLRRHRGKGLRHLSNWSSSSKRYISSGFIIGLLGFILYFLVRWLLGVAMIESYMHPSELTPVVAMTFVFTLYIAITEEIIFRGYLLSVMRESFSLKHSIFISLGLFVLGHLPKLHHLLHSPYAIHLIALGLVFTYAYVITGSIWLSIGIHWGWNLGGFSEDRILTLEYKPMGSWADPLSWIYIVVDLMLLVIIIKIYGKHKRDKA